MAVVLLVIAAAGIPLAILLYSDHGKKRGCGRGCATCGNREICHRRRKKPQKDV